jgi:hypothetical protein
LGTLLKRRGIAIGALTAGVVVLGAGAAYASMSYSYPTLSTTGASFNSGWGYFNSPGVNNGAWSYGGNVVDTDLGDGNAPYVDTQIDRYAWNRNYGAQVAGNQPVGGSWYAPGDAYVQSAALAVCRDRGAFLSDNCSQTILKNYNGG